jgi:hypothetical protein
MSSQVRKSTCVRTRPHIISVRNVAFDSLSKRLICAQNLNICRLYFVWRVGVCRFRGV